MPGAKEAGGSTALAELDDAAAVERCRSLGEGPDHAAFRAIYERHEADAFRFLRRLLGDDDAAEDALQDTFVRLYRSLASYDVTRPLRPYVLSIARNVAMDALRARKRSGPDPAAAERPAERTALDAAAASERGASIEDALSSLAAEHRTILLLRHAHGLKQEQIAEALDCTVRTVRNRLRAASLVFERELCRRGVVVDDQGSEEVAS